jgi:hypothetical protein
VLGQRLNEVEMVMVMREKEMASVVCLFSVRKRKNEEGFVFQLK